MLGTFFEDVCVILWNKNHQKIDRKKSSPQMKRVPMARPGSSLTAALACALFNKKTTITTAKTTTTTCSSNCKVLVVVVVLVVVHVQKTRIWHALGQGPANYKNSPRLSWSLFCLFVRSFPKCLWFEPNKLIASDQTWAPLSSMSKHVPDFNLSEGCFYNKYVIWCVFFIIFILVLI